MPPSPPPEPLNSDAAPSWPSRESRYAFASLALSAASAAWLALSVLDAPLPFDDYKQHQVGMTACGLGIVLAIAAYLESHRKRTVTFIAFLAAILTLAAYVVLQPL